jgi:hypothetical protein
MGACAPPPPMEFIYAKLEMSPPHPPLPTLSKQNLGGSYLAGNFFRPLSQKPRGGVQTDVGKKNSLSCHSEPPPLRSRGGGGGANGCSQKN